MKRLILLLIILCGFTGTASAVEDKALQDVLLSLETPFKVGVQQVKGDRIDDFQAQFVQKSHIASIDRTQHGEGEVQFRFIRNQEEGGAMFRWEYREPTVQEIVSDGRTMWFYLPENRQVIESDISQLSKQQGENPVTFLSGLGNLSRDFSVEWAEPPHDGDGNPVLALFPRKKSQYINQLEVVVDKAAVAEFKEKKEVGHVFPILSTAVVDPNGNRTAIFFQQVKINRNPSVDIFRFQRPEGVEVVKPSEQGLGY